MCALAGFAAATIVVVLAVILFALALVAMGEASWRILRPLLPGFVWGALIAAVILIPSWTLTRLSMASHRYIWLEGGGVQLQALISLVRPNYYHIFDLEHYQLPVNATWMYVYCGLVPLLLIALALVTMRRKPVILLSATIVVTIFMLGINTPVYAAIFPHLPNLLRGAVYPEYALLAFSFFMGATAAFTLDHYAKRLPWLLVWALVLFTSWDLVHTGSKRPMNTGQGGPRQHDRYRDDLEDTAAVARNFRDLSWKSQPPARFDHFDFAFLAGVRAAGFQRIPTTDGDNPFMLLRYRRLRGFFTTAKFWERRISVADHASPLHNMLSVQYISGFQTPPEATLLREGLEKAGEVHANRVYRNPRALPRFFLTPRVRKSSGEDDTFLYLGDSAFDPSAEAIVEGIPADRDGLAVAPVHTRRVGRKPCRPHRDHQRPGLSRDFGNFLSGMDRDRQRRPAAADHDQRLFPRYVPARRNQQHRNEVPSQESSRRRADLARLALIPALWLRRPASHPRTSSSTLNCAENRR